MTSPTPGPAGPDTARDASPRPADCQFRPPSITDRLNLSTVFPGGGLIELELGSGDGSFLVAWAARHPGRNFLGVERLLGRLRKIVRKTQRLGLRNVRVARIEAAYLVEYLLPAASVSALHLYFPDPWPKRRHRLHRLVQPRFAETLHPVLIPEGRVFLRTDDADYFAQMIGVFGAHSGFRPIETPADLAALHTDFERDFLAQGRVTHRAAYVRG